MPKKAKITIEYDGQKSVWETGHFNMQQFRDVKKEYDPGNPKPRFKPGDSTMTIVVFRPFLLADECIPVPTVEQAFGLHKMQSAAPDAEAIEESRRGMVSENDLPDEEGVLWDKMTAEEGERLIGKIIGDWEIRGIERKGRMFTLRVMHTNGGQTIDVTKGFDEWKKLGLLKNIHSEAVRAGILVE